MLHFPISFARRARAKTKKSLKPIISTSGTIIQINITAVPPCLLQFSTVSHRFYQTLDHDNGVCRHSLLTGKTVSGTLLGSETVMSCVPARSGRRLSETLSD